MNLSTEFTGLKFSHPFLLASAPPTRNADMIMRAFTDGWAGAVTKTITLTGTDSPQPRLSKSPRDSQIQAMQNIELLSEYSADTWCKFLRQIDENYSEPVIASIMASADNPGEWAELAQMTIEAGAKAVELNVSCPHGMPERAAGAFIGQDAVLTGEITSAVRERINAPIWVKLTPNVTDIAQIGKSAIDNGADALAAINTLSGVIGVDLDKMTPLPNVGGYSTKGGISGAAVKPIALRAVAELAHLGAPVSGMGGIKTWEDAAEFILLGAGTVQVCTEVMLRGFGIIKDLVTGLDRYAEEKGFESLDDMRGAALGRLVDFAGLPKGNNIKFLVNDKCDLCGDCITACDDGGYQAIVRRKKKAAINQKLCTRCGLCSIVCPLDAIDKVDLNQPAKTENG